MPHLGRFYYRVKGDPRNDERFQHGDIVLVDPISKIPNDAMVLLEEKNKKLIIKQLIGRAPRNLDKKIVGRVVNLYIQP